MADDVARAAASDELDEVREDVGVGIDVAAGNTGPGAVEVRITVVATAVAPLLDGDSVMTDVINAVVATGAAEEAGPATCAEDEAAKEEAGAAELEACWKEELGGGADEDCANEEDGACCEEDDGGADEEKKDVVVADEGDAEELDNPLAEATSSTTVSGIRTTKEGYHTCRV